MMCEFGMLPLFRAGKEHCPLCTAEAAKLVAQSLRDGERAEDYEPATDEDTDTKP